MLFSIVTLTIATVALWQGKLDGGNWVLAALGITAGHHAEDIVKAWRK